MWARSRVAMVVLASVAAVSAHGMLPASAASYAWPEGVVSGFSTPSGSGVWMPETYGAVDLGGSAGRVPNSDALDVNGPIVGGAATPSGHGYWLVAADGGVFAFGDAHFHGSMGAAHLNTPVSAMASTKSGTGYWLVAGDGGVFTFGDAPFFGSTGQLTLRQPVVGVSPGTAGKGYRLVARDGGVFSFGDLPFYGSLPGLGVPVTDAVGLAVSPGNKGYWIARRGGQVYGFGNARALGNYVANACDPVVAIVANPRAVGYRLVMQSGATVPFGHAPGGSRRTGNPWDCPSSSVDVLTLGGRIGPLQLGVSTEAELRAHLGAPDVAATGSFGIGSFPDYRAFGYDCANVEIPGGIPIHAFSPRPRPYCRTIYYVNPLTGTLAGLNTTSKRYATERGTSVGMSSTEAGIREGRPPTDTACLSPGIRLGDIDGYGDRATATQIQIWVGTKPTQLVSELSVDHSTNRVGVLFC